MVAAGLPHGVGLVDMAWIEDTSSSVQEAGGGDGRPEPGLFDVVSKPVQEAGGGDDRPNAAPPPPPSSNSTKGSSSPGRC